MENQHYDAVIIGAGIAGAMTACRLAEAGFKVLVLEAGERGPERVRLVGKYAESNAKFDSKPIGSPYRGRDGDKFAPFPDGENDYEQSKVGDKFKSGYVRRVGGSTWHFLGNVPRFLPNDFQTAKLYDVGLDWDIGYDDLEPWYCEAEKEIGVAGDDAEWQDFLGARRGKPFPMPKIWESYSDSVVIKALEGIAFDEVPIEVRGTPQARNSQLYDDRPACAGNSTCVPICPIGAKYDATVHVRRAERLGAIVMEKAVVSRLDVDEKMHIRSVAYRTYDKCECTVSGRIVVLAAHAVESARLLLVSRIGESEMTVANGSGQVGKNLMDHLQGQGAAISNEPLFPFRGPPTTSGVDNFRDGAFRRERAAFRMSLGNDGMGRVEHPLKTLEKRIAEGLFGKKLQTTLADDISRQFRISYSTEMLPREHNRVLLSDKVDELGIQKVKLEMKLDEYNVRAFDYARRVITRIFEVMKIPPTAMFFASDPRFYTGAGHIMGTCRMGRSPAKSVVDTDCRAHDHPNLFIIGASVFTTGATANPTLTATAIALRATEAMKRHLAEN